jgi:hypothetical protein
MTQDAHDTDDRETLWVTDAELLRRAGYSEKKGRRILDALDNDRRSGFPPRVKLWGNKRYWPAVKVYFARVGGLTMDAPQSKERRYG